MSIEGKWWILHEEEDLSLERTRLYELVGGSVLDGRTSEQIGTYVQAARGPILTLDSPDGDSTIIRFLTSGDESPEVADTFILDFSTAPYEVYRASLPTNIEETETEEQREEREHWEDERFGSGLFYGTALRDTHELRSQVESSDRERV